jgi:hypothetical protein
MKHAALVKQEEFYLSDLINEKQLSVPDAKYEYKRSFPNLSVMVRSSCCARTKKRRKG